MATQNDESDEDYEECGTIVIDNGSFSIKFGFAGDDCPKSQILTKVGRPKDKNASAYKKNSYIGDDLPNYDDFTVTNPIENRIIMDWDDIEKLWHYVFYNELKIVPEENQILLTEATYNKKSNREKMEQIMFETFNVPGLHVSAQQPLALYSCGRTTGYVLDSGYKITDIVPIYEGYALPHAIHSVKCGGYHVTEHLMNKYNIIDISKLHLCQQQTYKLPDGTEVQLDNKLETECVDILFDKNNEIIKIFHDSVMKLDIDIRKDMLNNICLCGANFMWNGMDDRLWNDLDIKTNYGLDGKLIKTPNIERKFAVWIGGSILASLSTFESMFTSKEMYDESGPSIVHRKCFGGDGGSGGSNIGFSVGGSKDVGNFRQCIENNIMPKETSITVEGIYYDYYFKTDHERKENENENEEQKQNANALFYPSYLYSTSKIPNALIVDDGDSDHDGDTDEYEYFLTLGLNSNLKESDFQRNKLNIVIVLDISGSMSSPFNYTENIQKMSIANDAIIALLKHLDINDRIGLVLFNTEAFVKNPLELISKIDLNKFIVEITNITADGGTDMQIGYKTALHLYDNIADNDEYDNRIIYLTDAQPNYGQNNAQSLLAMIRECSEREIGKIYTTLIGVGLDFNTNLIEIITKVNGANYYTAHSKQDFMQRMDQQFDFMVTPLVFNLKLNLKSEGNSCYIYKTYGSAASASVTTDNDNDNVREKEIMSINTLFPSKKNDSGETKGGMVLLQIKKNVTNDNNNLNMKITVSYEDRKGNKYSTNANVVFHNKGNNKNKNDMIEEDDYFDNEGIRKAILLTRYVLLIKQWIKNMNMTQQTQILSINREYREKFVSFVKYFEKEMKEINDESLKKELKILHKLSNI